MQLLISQLNLNLNLNLQHHMAQYINNLCNIIMEEIWKNIISFEGYMVSNKGRIKSSRRGKEKILTLLEKTNKYLCINLMKASKMKQRLVHRLVAEAFLENFTKECIINHIDMNKQNNNVENLECVTQRHNVHHSIDSNKGTSKFIGVHKHLGSWRAEIYIDGKSYHLGKFKTEMEASLEYNRLLNIFNIEGLESFLRNRLNKSSSI